jgi:hypothetical protein
VQANWERVQEQLAERPAINCQKVIIVDLNDVSPVIGISEANTVAQLNRHNGTGSGKLENWQQLAATGGNWRQLAAKGEDNGERARY